MRKHRTTLPDSDEDRISLVKRIFANITPKYDFLNRFLSLRRDVSWRAETVRQMRFFNTNRYLDVATGTGDLALEAIRLHPEISAEAIDFVPEMIEAARVKAEYGGLNNRVSFNVGDALSIDFDDNTFDCTAIAFGIRNIPDKIKALSEMARVVAPGGQVMVLELTTPASGFIRSVYSLYLTRLLPAVGSLFSGDATAYRYLAESILDFPTPKKFAIVMQEAGLIDIRMIPLTFGVAHLHIGKVPD